jgi:hypothetical protein
MLTRIDMKNRTGNKCKELKLSSLQQGWGKPFHAKGAKEQRAQRRS